MKLYKHSILFALTAFLCIITDCFYLGIVARGFYANHIGHVVTLNMDATLFSLSSFIAWFLLALGLYVFVIMQRNTKTFEMTLLHGFLYGFVVYGIYNSTNSTLFAEWKLFFALSDVLWGTLLCGIITAIVLHIKKMLEY